MYGSFMAYNHPHYDLNGNWDSQSKRMHLWFPLVNLEPEQIANFASDCDVSLLKKLKSLITEPTAELVISDEVTTPDTDHYIYDPPVYASELIAEEQSGSGLAIVSGKYSADMARYTLNSCGLAIENTFAEHMLERVEN